MDKIFIFLKDNREKALMISLFVILVLVLFPTVLRFFSTNEKAPPVDPPPPPQERWAPTFGDLHKIESFEDIVTHIFYVDDTAYVVEEDFPIEKLASLDLRLNMRGSTPKVLITHTHSHEYFIDSEEGNINESIVGVGRVLAHILADVYGVSVVHDIGAYDVLDGEIVREGAYERMEVGVQEILERHPQIELIIDLHRDAMPDDVRLVSNINGIDTAKIMFFNGITRRNVNGAPAELYELFNPYIMENLALSLQLFLTANEHFEGFARRNYIKAYRYSLHMRPRSILVEVGANTNTLEEAKNAMAPLASILMKVLNINEIEDESEV